MKDLDKNFKIKVLALFLISNISTYLLCTEPEQNYDLTSPSQVEPFKERPNYIKIKIKGHSLSPEMKSNTISLLDEKNRVIIPHGFYIKQLPSQYNEVLSERAQMEESFLIYVHTKYISKISPTRLYKIVPYLSELNIKPKIRRAYELRY